MMLSDVCLSDVCLTSVAYIRSAGGVCGLPAGWRVLADRARLGRPGSRLPLRASVQAWTGAYRGGRPPTACFIVLRIVHLVRCTALLIIVKYRSVLLANDMMMTTTTTTRRR